MGHISKELEELTSDTNNKQYETYSEDCSVMGRVSYEGNRVMVKGINGFHRGRGTGVTLTGNAVPE